MRATDRMQLVETIASELQRRYTFTDIDVFLAAFAVDTQGFQYGGSKRVYVKDVLRCAPETSVLEIVDELGIGGPIITGVEPPKNWAGTSLFRLFISHVSAAKQKATRLKDALQSHSISGFVAHEDIFPTLKWQDEIERALGVMDAFVAIHTLGFQNSVWTQQEVRFALGRGVKVISFKMGEDPKGFIGKHQALAHDGRTAELIAAEISALLAGDARTSDKLKTAQRFVGW